MYCLGFSINISPIKEQKTEYIHTAPRVYGSILRDGPLGNWQRDGVPTGTPANAPWRSWAPMASYKASSTIKYVSSEMIGRGVFQNMIASMNRFAMFKVAFSICGTLRSPPTFGWGTFWSPPAFGSRSACTTSDSRDVLMVEFWHFSNDGSIALTACRRFGSGVRAMTVSAQLHLFRSGTIVIRMILSWRAWSRCWISC